MKKELKEKKLYVAEMRMLRWICGVTKLDRIRNERVRGTTKVREISKKVHCRSKWYGHVLRREEEYVGKIVMVTEVPGKRRRGRPKRRWVDNIKNNLSERELLGEEAQTQEVSHKKYLMRHLLRCTPGKYNVPKYKATWEILSHEARTRHKYLLCIY